MSRVLRVTGFIACLAAILAMSGGHWLALQTVAWGRMIADFTRQDSLGTAVSKTFSGKHPCSLCVKVRKGFQQEKEREQKQPWLKAEKAPEAAWQWRLLSAPPAPLCLHYDSATVPDFPSDFISSPPTPPPRRSPAAL